MNQELQRLLLKVEYLRLLEAEHQEAYQEHVGNTPTKDFAEARKLWREYKDYIDQEKMLLSAKYIEELRKEFRNDFKKYNPKAKA